jgi:hypothetical protein
MVNQQNICPSCRHKLSPLTIECPVCGIPLSRQPLKRPLLFQVSKSDEPPPQNTPKFITAPAIGRIAPVNPSSELPVAKTVHKANVDIPNISGIAVAESHQTDAQSTFWRLARMEFQEAVSLLILNGGIVFVAHWQLKLSAYQTYTDFWPYLLTLHALVSWAYFMLPIVLTGSSIAMMRLGFGIADTQPEKRLSFSLFMLVSVALIPFSFLCMVLTPAHTTLAELLTGQEIRERTPDLMHRY